MTVDAERDPTAEDDATREVSPAAADPDELPRGALVGRYVILGLLGSGGMGRVYQAADPELDRRIALKLVRVRDADGRASARLLREAQALAQLSQPNVVTVYDAGRWGEDVYVAMELVEGTTLRAWLRERSQSREAILDVLVSAGRGLAAAHRAGIVHRDFKPANVMLGADGRVRVLDFGIARAELGAVARPTAAPAAPTPQREPVDEPLSTRTGESPLRSTELTAVGDRLGTPAYMAPEQHAGIDVDARADQFAFCVVLYEAIRGKRPFSGRTMAELVASVSSGRTVEPLAELNAPAWLRQLIARGLSPDPAQRFPTMEELLGELTRDRTRGRRRALAAAAVVALTGAGIATGLIVAGGRTSPCQRVDDEISSAWNPTAAAAIRKAFAASGRPYAIDSASRVVTILDGYSARWRATRRDTCEASLVRGQQAPEVMARRMECLERRRGKLAALTAALRRSPGDQLLKDAVELARDLPAVDDCSDREALLVAVPLPDSPRTRGRVAVLRQSLDEIEARSHTADIKPALAHVASVAAEARTLDYAPVLAESLYLRAYLELAAGDPRSAEQTLYESLQAAAEAKDDVLTARIWTRLINVIGDAQARHDDALALRKSADPALIRADAAPRLRADFLDQIGTVLWAQAKYRESRAYHDQAYMLRTLLLPPDDPDIAVSLLHLGSVAWSQGRLAEARQLLLRAVSIREVAYGPEHPDVAKLLTGVGSVAVSQGDLATAAAYHRRALAITERSLGADHMLVAVCANNLADVEKKLGHHTEARQLLLRAEGLFVAALGPGHPHVATTIQNLGEVALATGQPADALIQYERALASFEAAVGADHPFVAYPLTGIGQANLALGRATSALAPLERALRIREGSDTPATDLATTQFTLARALAAASRDRARAARLAGAARTALANAGPGFASDLRAVDAWLAARP